jgi:biopolymer transport protein TolQ
MQGQLNLLHIILESGPVVKAVLAILIISSVLAWAIIWQKYQEMKVINTNNKKFLEVFTSGGSLGDIYQQAINFQYSTFGMIYRKGYEEINKLNEKLGGKSQLADYFKVKGLENIERSLKHGFNSATEKLENRVSILATIGSLTPFVGLFGTVWGIINAFSGLASGGGSIDAVAPGIAEALVATAVGLAAAIPAVLFFNHFNTENSKIQSEMESFSQDFLNLVERSLILTKREG